MSRLATVLLWTIGSGAATAAAVAWWTSGMDIPAADRTPMIVGTTAVFAFAAGLLAAVTTKKA